MPKSKLTEELIDTLCKYVSEGAYNYTACEMVGINEASLYRWLGQKDKGGLFVKLSKSLKKAQGGFEHTHVKQVSLDPQWQSSAWILERRFPERWAKKEPPMFQMNIAQLTDGYKDLLVSEVKRKLLQSTDN